MYNSVFVYKQSTFWKYLEINTSCNFYILLHFFRERREMNPDLIELALPLIFPGYVLGCTVTEVIVSTASKALDKFGKNSVKYLEEVGKIEENLGKSIMKDGDKILKLTGKNLEAIGKN